MEGGSSLDIAKAARDDGIHSLRESGLLKVAKGIISLAEANRVTNF